MHVWCNQLVPELSLKLSDTLHIKYRYNEHVHEVSWQNFFFFAKWLLMKQPFCMAFVFSIVVFFIDHYCAEGYLISIAYLFFFCSNLWVRHSWKHLLFTKVVFVQTVEVNYTVKQKCKCVCECNCNENKLKKKKTRRLNTISLLNEPRQAILCLRAFRHDKF